MMSVRVEHGGHTLSSANPPAAGTGGLSCIVVESFDRARLGEWNTLVRRVPHAGFFHGSAWMEVLQTAYGFQPMGLVFRRQDQIVGLIPVVEVLSRWTGCRGVSLPFADECPPLIPEGITPDNLLLALVDYTRSKQWDYFEIRGTNGGLQPTLPSVCFHGHRIELPRTPEALWDRLKGPVRTGVRKAESLGVTAEFPTTIEGLREFHRLYRLTRQRHGLPPQPFRFFQAIYERVLRSGEGRLVLARAKGRVIAGAVFFRYGNRALFKYGAFDTNYQHLRANNLVLW
jgi:hypothetical protein